MCQIRFVCRIPRVMVGASLGLAVGCASAPTSEDSSKAAPETTPVDVATIDVIGIEDLESEADSDAEVRDDDAWIDAETGDAEVVTSDVVEETPSVETISVDELDVDVEVDVEVEAEIDIDATTAPIEVAPIDTEEPVVDAEIGEVPTSVDAEPEYDEPEQATILPPGRMELVLEVASDDAEAGSLLLASLAARRSRSASTVALVAAATRRLMTESDDGRSFSVARLYHVSLRSDQVDRLPHATDGAEVLMAQGFNGFAHVLGAPPEVEGAGDRVRRYEATSDRPLLIWDRRAAVEGWSGWIVVLSP